ncbi:DENN domain-containing protein 1B-like [Oppia nitens]|uniref:DENN domain-containing protein 1B-like n=1 Tax=Oppia nitens TaxID=1686743 RepID=UPI0023DCE170|nr:DENN domain-containing protein 1B-like [Oppia nitens]
MGSRMMCFGDICHLFECYLEIACPSTATTDQPFILQKYPDSYSQQEILKSVPQFAYPCPLDIETVTHFSFVLTNIDSKWTFGFCRHAPRGHTCLVMLSYLPWHSTFFRVLNHCAELTNNTSAADGILLSKFLEAVYVADIPQPGLQLNVTYCDNNKILEFTTACPDHHKMPSIPEDRNLTEYFNAIDAMNMIVIFANMLNERRIIMTSKKLSRLSACVQAANSLIYPMHWQHIFIPVLPKHLLDYLSAPMPFLIGVPAVIMNRVKRSELGDIVILDCDDNRIDSPFDDIHMLPTDVVHTLKKSLRNPMSSMLGDSVARSFLRALVSLIGAYRDALRFTPGQKISFNYEAFVSSRSPSVQTFLEKMLQLQIFRQFIEGRLEMLNNGEGFSDEFEFEVNMYEEKSTHRLKTQYKEWLGAMRKEGGAILKNVNPVMRSAYKQVKDKSRRAYKDLKTKIQNNENKAYSYADNTHKSSSYKVHKPSSAPSSPTLPMKPSNIKKSVSGNVIGKTDKTITYVRQRNTLIGDNNDKPITSGLQNGFSKSLSVNSGLSSVTSKTCLSSVNSMAPEASPEASDVDSEHSHDMLTFDRIEIDLMGELKDFLHKKSSDESTNSSKSNKSIQSQSSCNSSLQTNAMPFITKPLPPPRSHLVRKSKPETNKEESLIELDTPPDDDSNVIFDPLLEDKPSESKTFDFQTLRNNWNSFATNNTNNNLNDLRLSLSSFATPVTAKSSLVNPFLLNDSQSQNQTTNSFEIVGQMPSVTAQTANTMTSDCNGSALINSKQNQFLSSMINWSSQQINNTSNNNLMSTDTKATNSWQQFD